ncbi:MAG TPA: hypothetical protein PK313_16440, partial [Myxococcota bacterium]|nr:hypothetical protein [Myxococcota bacterium]
LRATAGEGASTDAVADAALRAAVLADWDLQEQRLGRSPHSPEAIRAAARRAALLLHDLRGLPAIGDLAVERAEFERLRAHAENSGGLDEPSRLDLYRRIRSLAREVALRNPLVTSRPLLFMERRRAVGYMLYEYLGWYYAHGNNPDNGARNPQVPTPVPGGGIHVLEQPGRTLRTRPVIPGPEWRGHFVTLALSFDARTIYFAFADPAGRDPYARPGYAREPGQAGVKYNTFHLWAMNADGSHLRQITDGPYDDFDPCPLPDGGLAFQSTRRGCKLRCGGGSPEHAYTLHRMDADGGNLRTLSFHETHEWHPSVLNDGRLVYTRWDYVDRNAAKFHGLWTCNPDGTNPANFFGN